MRVQIALHTPLKIEVRRSRYADRTDDRYCLSRSRADANQSIMDDPQLVNFSAGCTQRNAHLALVPRRPRSAEANPRDQPGVASRGACRSAVFTWGCGRNQHLKSINARNREFLSKWHPLVVQKNLSALDEILAEDVTMGAPPYWDRLSGRPIVHHLLGLIIRTIEDFTYHREWHDDSQGKGEIALEFRGHIGHSALQGIDLITLDANGQIQNLDVMIRPMNTLEELRKIIAPQMLEFLQNHTG
jgi:hypothetical protein